MPFLELTVPCSDATQPRYEAALEAVGALAVTLLDADADSDAEHAILEPGVGETPLWQALTLTALFDGDADGLALLAALDGAGSGLDWSRTSLRRVDDQDWERAWMDTYAPLRFGEHLWIVPWDHPLPDGVDDAVDAVVRLDPGLAFGSGTHPTTALCLRWLDALAGSGDLAGRRVLDFGSGSGILALAALKLGAADATAVDNDPQALLATRDNADRNGVGATLSVHLPDDAPSATYPVVIANILASALDALADTLAARVAPGGQIALSGILVGQQDPLLVRYAKWFTALEVAIDGDWVRIDGVRLAADDAAHG